MLARHYEDLRPIAMLDSQASANAAGCCCGQQVMCRTWRGQAMWPTVLPSSKHEGMQTHLQTCQVAGYCEALSAVCLPACLPACWFACAHMCAAWAHAAVAVLEAVAWIRCSPAWPLHCSLVLLLFEPVVVVVAMEGSPCFGAGVCWARLVVHGWYAVQGLSAS